MTERRARNVYVPPSILEELESIKADLDLKVNTEAFRKMAQYCRVGREAERIRNGFLGIRRSK